MKQKHTLCSTISNLRESCLLRCHGVFVRQNAFIRVNKENGRNVELCANFELTTAYVSLQVLVRLVRLLYYDLDLLLRSSTVDPRSLAGRSQYLEQQSCWGVSENWHSINRR